MLTAVATAPRWLRLLLLLCTALGVAGLHTLGHTAVVGVQGHSTTGTVAGLAAASPADDDGCAGDGCTHHAGISAATREDGRWWDVCLAVLTALATGALVAALLMLVGRLRAHDLRPPPAQQRSARYRIPPPLRGLTVTAVTVIRV